MCVCVGGCIYPSIYLSISETDSLQPQLLTCSRKLEPRSRWPMMPATTSSYLYIYICYYPCRCRPPTNSNVLLYVF